MAVTLTYGLVKPVTGDRGAVWFPAIENDIIQLDAHDHNGTNSAQLGNAAILTAAAIARTKIASGTAYRILANTSAGVMSENAALTFHRVIVGDTNGQLTNNAALTSAHVVYADSNGELAGEATLAVSRGGTNIASYTTGDLLHATGTTTLSKLAIGTTGQVLKVVGGDTAWGSPATSLATGAKTTTYSILNTDDFLTADTGTGFTMTLPDCATNAGKVFKIKKISSDFNVLTISKAGSDTIQDSGSATTSTTLNTIGEEIEIVAAGSTVWQIINRKIPSFNLAYTPTYTGFGTVTTDTAFWKRVGSGIQLSFTFTTGTSTSVTAKISLPTGLVMDTAKISTRTILGPGVVGSASTPHPTPTIDTSETGVIKFIDSNAAGAQFAFVTNAAALFGTGNDVSVSCAYAIPISGWNG